MPRHLRGLLAHASHRHWRSPLTRLRLAVEMFSRDPGADLAADIAADIAELDGLVEEILLASRLDHGPAESSHEVVDLLAIAAEEAARAGAAVRVEGADRMFVVTGSARLLRRMVRNLLENAVRHGAPPLEIILAHAGAAPGVTMTVRDHGPGVPSSERERVFEPFYRPVGSAEAQGSWGLGLSIVRQIARRHGGEASCGADPPADDASPRGPAAAGAGATSEASGGARFVVTLPSGAETARRAPSAPTAP